MRKHGYKGTGAKRMKKGFISLFVSLLLLSVFFPVSCLAVGEDEEEEAEGPAIVTQPADADVAYPYGTTFHVEAEDPDEVVSYQWILNDGKKDVILDGTSAHTDTLIIPSTRQKDKPVTLRCELTDSEGNVSVSEEAVFRVVNGSENKPVLYVGEYALQPGETMDLSRFSEGSGSVTFHENGTEITFEDFQFNDLSCLFDRELSSSKGVSFVRIRGSIQPYYFHFKGKCSINNTYYDPEKNDGDITLLVNFGSYESGQRPTVVFDGDGELTLIGGSCALYSDVNVEIRNTLITKPYEDHPCYGIICQDLTLDEGGSLDILSNGTGIMAQEDIHLKEGSILKIESAAPRANLSQSVETLISAGGDILAEGASLELTARGIEKNFVPYKSFIASYTAIASTGEGDIVFDHSDVKIRMDAERSDTLYAIGFAGIGGNDLHLLGASVLDIAISAPEVISCTGIGLSGSLFAEKDCTITIDIDASGNVAGMEVREETDFTDCNVDIHVLSENHENTYGIITGRAKIDLTEEAYSVHALAEEGTAFLTILDEETPEAEYDAGYKSTHTTLSRKVRILSPGSAKISTWADPEYEAGTGMETVYSRKDTSLPASEVTFGVRKDEAVFTLLSLAILAGAGYATYRLTNKKRRDA